MTAPTEAEIREAVQNAWDAEDPEDLARDAFAGLATTAAAALWETTWDGTDQGAGIRQDRIVDEQVARVVATFEDRVVEFITAALVRFAAEYPDIQRKPQLIPA